MALAYPDPLDDEGNINVHETGALAGLGFSIRENGRVIDASAMPLFFEVPEVAFRKALAAHPTDAKARWLSLTKAECAGIPLAGAKYVIFDETGGQPVDLMKGEFRRYR